jgi:hypothetical protein
LKFCDAFIVGTVMESVGEYRSKRVKNFFESFNPLVDNNKLKFVGIVLQIKKRIPRFSKFMFTLHYADSSHKMHF